MGQKPPPAGPLPKFTREVEKSKVVKAKALAKHSQNIGNSGPSVSANSTIKELARFLMDDSRDVIPVVQNDGEEEMLLGGMDRKEALEILFGSD